MPTGAALKGKHLYQYLQNGHENMVRNDECVSNHRLWYPDLALMIDMYCTLFNLGNISLSVRPLCIGLINA